MDLGLHRLVVRDDDPPVSGNSSADQFLQLISDPFSTEIQSDAALASLITSLALTGIVTLIFCIVRPYHALVYAPRLKYSDEKHAPPRLTKSPWAWIKPIATTTEERLVDEVGMDAVLFLRFTSMCRNIFLVLSLVGCGILIPVNILGGKKDFNGWHDVSALMKLTPQYMFGQVYWAFVACAYLLNIVVCVFLWWNYRAVLRLRRRYLESSEYQSQLASRTLMVNDIPRELRTDDGVEKIVEKVRMTQDVPRGVIARNVKELPELIKQHEEAVTDLEKVLAKYLKNPEKLPPQRPVCKPSKKDRNVKDRGKVDAIDYLNGRRRELEAEIKQIRLSVDNRNALSYGFASYSSVEDAHNVAFTAKKKRFHGATMRLAPSPKDVIWYNMNMSKAARRRNKIMNGFWMTLLTLIWIVPNIGIAVFLTNLSNLGKFWPAFQKELLRHPKQWAIVQGVLSPAITTLVYYYLPAIFRRLSIKSGDRTKTSRERHVTSRLFVFFILNNLILFSIFGTIFQFAASIYKSAQDKKGAWEAVKDAHFFSGVMISLSNLSPYWLSWLLQRNLGAAIDLSQVANVAKSWFLTKFRSPTPRQRVEWTAPPPFDYASYYNYFLFYAAVALSFATLQPLVLPVTAIYFCVDSWLKKYLLMYVFVTKVESGGLFWRTLFNRMLFAVLLGDVVVALVVKANGHSWTMLGVMAGLPFLLLAFKIYCSHAFDDRIAYYSRANLKDPESATQDKHSKRSHAIRSKFGHPALYKPLMKVMVHKKAQHLVGEILGTTVESDETIDSGYSDTFAMDSMARGKPGQTAKTSKSEFEFVDESDINFENYKDHPDFRDDHGGGGELYGKPEDSRPGTARTLTGLSDGTSPDRSRPAHQAYHDRSRSQSRDSERTLPDATTYPPGYHQTPRLTTARSYSSSGPGPVDERQNSTDDILRGAAPMATGWTPSPLAGPEAPRLDRRPTESPLSGGNGATTYDYFRGRS